MTYYFLSVEDAKNFALGYTPSATLQQYYDSWQYLYDNEADLGEADMYYLDKLICDGSVLTEENYNELQGVAYYPCSPGALREASLSDD